jgi:RimJ/RimL family protein N-acetyltransferase
VSTAIEYRQLESPALRMTYFAVPWDSEIFGFTVAQIDSIELGAGDPSADFLEFQRWCRDHSVRLTSCRLPHDRLRESAWLEAHGFRFIEMVYRPRFDRLEQEASPAAELVIDRALAGDLPALEEIADLAFTTGRFHLDPQLDRALSGKRYRSWVRSSFANPDHQVLKATLDGALVGFFVVEEADAAAYWHLTAMAPAFQGRGIGESLWRAMMARHRLAGVRAVETTISAHNVAVINLYAKLGFRFGEAQMTFHCTEAQ